MKFRWKLVLVFLMVSLASALLAISIVYATAKQLVMQEIGSNAIGIAASAAAVIDPERLKVINETWDTNTPEYKKIQDRLRKVRDLNRRGDFSVKYIYTVQLSTKEPNTLLFGVDAEENPVEFAHPGDRILSNLKDEIAVNITDTFTPLKFGRDPWGIWLSGFAPIYDKDGKFVGAVGVDISAKDVEDQLNKLIVFGSWAFLGAFILALFMAFNFSKQVTSPLSSLCTSVKEIGEGHLETKATLQTHDEFNDLAEAINEMTKGLRERERLKMSFARYVSQHVLDKILHSETPMKLEGERKRVTILFSDIRGFTHLAEGMSPERLVGFLNEYFEKMLTVIFQNSGTIDKFIGDGIMAEFGAPLEDAQQEKHAIQTAIQMQEDLKTLCDKWEKEGKPRIEIGIGIHTGYAVVGNIGTERRMEYTAIGDAVNIASRLERATRVHHKPIIVSENTFLAAKDEGFEFENLGPIALPGKTDKIVAYAIFPKGKMLAQK